jgi:antitoxin component HigA of HigAB toxin-antitoxin module
MKETIEKNLTEEQYEKLMEDILHLMNKGEANLSESELDEILEMALLAQAYEREHHYPANLR